MANKIGLDEKYRIIEHIASEVRIVNRNHYGILITFEVKDDNILAVDDGYVCFEFDLDGDNPSEATVKCAEEQTATFELLKIAYLLGDDIRVMANTDGIA